MAGSDCFGIRNERKVPGSQNCKNQRSKKPKIKNQRTKNQRTKNQRTKNQKIKKPKFQEPKNQGTKRKQLGLNENPNRNGFDLVLVSCYLVLLNRYHKTRTKNQEPRSQRTKKSRNQNSKNQRTKRKQLVLNEKPNRYGFDLVLVSCYLVLLNRYHKTRTKIKNQEAKEPRGQNSKNQKKQPGLNEEPNRNGYDLVLVFCYLVLIDWKSKILAGSNNQSPFTIHHSHHHKIFHR